MEFRICPIRLVPTWICSATQRWCCSEAIPRSICLDEESVTQSRNGWTKNARWSVEFVRFSTQELLRQVLDGVEPAVISRNDRHEGSADSSRAVGLVA